MPTHPEAVSLVALRDAALSVDEVLDAVRHPTCGGIALFVGVVRDHDHGDPVTALDYEAHPSALETMRAHGGHIQADHAPTAGARITLRLPLARAGAGSRGEEAHGR